MKQLVVAIEEPDGFFGSTLNPTTVMKILWMKRYFVSLFLSAIAMTTTGQQIPKTDPVKFLALGDSYTIGEGVPDGQRWPAQFINALMLEGYTCHQPEIVARTGWRTDALMKAINEAGLPADYNVVSLLIGVNNQYQGGDINEYKTEFEHLLTTAIACAGGIPAKVFVLSIPDYGYTPLGQEKQVEISQQIDAFNDVNRSVSKKNGVTYIDITDISRRGLKEPDLIAPDGLHPSAKMYALWVERILERLR